MNSIIKRTADYLGGWPEPVVSMALLLAAGGLICIALMPGKPILKAGALAYVLLP